MASFLDNNSFNAMRERDKLRKKWQEAKQKKLDQERKLMERFDFWKGFLGVDKNLLCTHLGLDSGALDGVKLEDLTIEGVVAKYPGGVQPATTRLTGVQELSRKSQVKNPEQGSVSSIYDPRATMPLGTARRGTVGNNINGNDDEEEVWNINDGVDSNPLSAENRPSRSTVAPLTDDIHVPVMHSRSTLSGKLVKISEIELPDEIREGIVRLPFSLIFVAKLFHELVKMSDHPSSRFSSNKRNKSMLRRKSSLRLIARKTVSDEELHFLGGEKKTVVGYVKTALTELRKTIEDLFFAAPDVVNTKVQEDNAANIPLSPQSGLQGQGGRVRRVSLTHLMAEMKRTGRLAAERKDVFTEQNLSNDSNGGGTTAFTLEYGHEIMSANVPGVRMSSDHDGSLVAGSPMTLSIHRPDSSHSALTANSLHSLEHSLPSYPNSVLGLTDSMENQNSLDFKTRRRLLQDGDHDSRGSVSSDSRGSLKEHLEAGANDVKGFTITVTDMDPRARGENQSAKAQLQAQLPARQCAGVRGDGFSHSQWATETKQSREYCGRRKSGFAYENTKTWWFVAGGE